MYSFAQRKDTQILDEPLYGHYLRVSGAEHPGREEIMATMNCNGDEVMAELTTQSGNQPAEVLFMKQMAHHRPEDWPVHRHRRARPKEGQGSG